jgi:RimJ/RimL family protein N-acetyltransferase
MFLSSELGVSLGPFERKHYKDATKFMNDPLTTYYMFYGQRPLTEERGVEMFEAQVSSPSNVVFAVRDDKDLLGFAGLYDIHLSAQKADFRILLSAAKCGKGLGTEVTKMLLYYGFDRLNLHRIALGVTSENIGAIKAYKKAGYVEEGVLRDDIFRNGRWYDSIKMAMLRSEYEEKYAKDYRERFEVKPPGRPAT